MGATIQIKEAALILGVTQATVYNWIKQDIIRSVKKDNKLFFNRSEILQIKEKIENGEIERLAYRANKKNSLKVFQNIEYFNNDLEKEVLGKISNLFTEHHLSLNETIYVLTLNRLVKNKVIDNLSLENLLKPWRLNSLNQNFRQELQLWQNELDFKRKTNKYALLLEISLPDEGDFIGQCYQSLLTEGQKSKKGLYYTPNWISSEIVNENVRHANGYLKVLDPCCGTGQFLLAAGEKLQKSGKLFHPSDLWGYDIDPLAVKIARMNVMIAFKNYDFSPNIFHRDFIYNFTFDDKSNKHRKFDLILGNPPWGSEFRIEQTSFLKESFPDILSFESYSYFVFIGLNMLSSKGRLSFVLPESILNIKTHKDIRNYILQNCHISLIKSYGRAFKSVFSNVVRIDLSNKPDANKEVKIILPEEAYIISQRRFDKNEDKIFDVYLNPDDEHIIRKFYSLPHINLKGNADWGLGIVTGNNDLHLSEKHKKGFVPVFRGSDVERFYFKKPEQFLDFTPEKFQQVAPLSKYKSHEKLIYRFISNKLIVACDNHQRFTLNSANFLIPKLEKYPSKLIMALFNSHLYQFAFRKKFFSPKILKTHLEQLPLPLIDESSQLEILALVEKLMISYVDPDIYSERLNQLNELIFKVFGISDKEKERILTEAY